MDSQSAAERLQEVVSETCQRLFNEKILTASIGVANFPADGRDAEQLLAEADRRMYKEKRAHKRVPFTADAQWAPDWVATIQ